MSFFPWAMIFLGLAILGAASLGLVGWRLWRGFKALGHQAAVAGEAMSRLGDGISSAGRGGAR